MRFDLPDLLLAGAQAYVALGLLVAVAFLLLALERFDPTAEGSYLFRPLLIPGLTLLWPLVVLRWAQLIDGNSVGNQRHAARHRAAWICLALVVPALLIFGPVERQVKLPAGSSQQVSASGVRP